MTRPLGGGYVEDQNGQDNPRQCNRSRGARRGARWQPRCRQRRDNAHIVDVIGIGDDDGGQRRVCEHGGDSLAVRVKQAHAQLPEHEGRQPGRAGHAKEQQHRQLGLR